MMGAHPTTRLEVVRLFDEGLSYENIAKAVKIPREHVKQHVYMARSLGEIADEHPRLRHKYGEKKEAIYRHLKDGKRPPEIAKLMGLTLHAVHHSIHSMRANPKDRDPSVLRYREPTSLAYVFSTSLKTHGKTKGGVTDFGKGLADWRIVELLVAETPEGMTVMEYAAKIIVDHYAENP